MQYGTMPPNMRQTVMSGMRAKSFADSIAAATKNSTHSSPSQPANTDGSGLWVLGLAAVVTGLVSLFTGTADKPAAGQGAGSVRRD